LNGYQGEYFCAGEGRKGGEREEIRTVKMKAVCARSGVCWLVEGRLLFASVKQSSLCSVCML
jgi:hypothetical protein